MHLTAHRRIVWLTGLTLACAGCDGISNAWYNSFIDPTQVGNFRDNVVLDIQRSISFRDTPVGIVGAEDPKPEDLVAEVEEYEIGPGDTLEIRLLDFVQLGVETGVGPVVDELGFIDIPPVKKIHAEGRTARELQSDIIQLAKAAGIYLPDDEPTVTVTVANPTQRMYNLSGQLLYPGPYRIPRPDFRLRESINLGGGMDDTIKTVWVYRNAPRDKKVRRRPDLIGPASQPDGEPSIPAGPPVSPVYMSDVQASPGGPAQGTPPDPKATQRPVQTNSRPAGQGGLALPAENGENELIDALSKTPPATSPAGKAQKAVPQNPIASAAPASNPSAAPTGTSGGVPSYKFVNDAFIQDTGAKGAAGPQPPPATTESTTPTEGPAGQPVDWEVLASERQQRIIRIPADKLRNGDPNYDIVIRHEDWVRVDPGPVGYYYLDGQVQRPGPYGLLGEQITLTQAIASAGGLSQLAWPTRCEIRRRLDQDREEITQWDMARILDGKDPDLYLKPNDVVRVGTHAIAPLLATIRNSFRFTYGFGFVYDRNFADIDSYGSDINPTLRRREAKNTRLQGLQNLFR